MLRVLFTVADVASTLLDELNDGFCESHCRRTHVQQNQKTNEGNVEDKAIADVFRSLGITQRAAGHRHGYHHCQNVHFCGSP